MIMEIVNFNIAKKLKEKGFRKPCVATYDKDGMLGYNYIQPTSIRAVGFDECLVYSNDCVMAPTISQVLKWLRDEKGIYIIIQPYSTMAFENKVAWDWSFKYKSNGAFMEHAYPSWESYETYEQTAIKAIEFVLDNLI